MLIALSKPYDVLSQFTRELPQHRTLADFGLPPDVYPVGRLDRDSEGLLLLTDEARYNDLLLHPRQRHPRTYHAQVEGAVSKPALMSLRSGGIDVQGHRTLPCQAETVDPPPIHEPRVPPIRVRLTVPTSWIELTLVEGKNRQVRRMTAAVGFPTLRLIRVQIGNLKLADLGIRAGDWCELQPGQIKTVLAGGGGRL
jgi:23S rRNA pseudouridine2457 synthase